MYTEDAPGNAWMDIFVEQSQLQSMACFNGNVKDSVCTYNQDSTTPGVGQTRDENGGNGQEHLSSYYVWDTGINRWNKFAGIKNSSGDIVKFDEPVILSYNVPDSAAYGSFRNKVATIKYPGEGRLWLPGFCKNVGDSTAATSAACNNPDSSRETNKGLERWINNFVIPYSEGPEGRVISSSGTEYLVKWTRKGIYYPTIADSNCTSLASTLTAASTRALPEASAWLNPMDASSPNYIGAFSNFRDEEPLYVQGVRR